GLRGAVRESADGRPFVAHTLRCCFARDSSGSNNTRMQIARSAGQITATLPRAADRWRSSAVGGGVGFDTSCRNVATCIAGVGQGWRRVFAVTEWEQGASCMKDGVSRIELVAERWSAEQTLRWAFETFNDQIAISSAFGAGGMVLIDIASRVNPNFRLFT